MGTGGGRGAVCLKAKSISSERRKQILKKTKECVCVCVCVRERERETERQKERDRKRERERERESEAIMTNKHNKTLNNSENEQT